MGIQSLSRDELLQLLAVAKARRYRDYVMILLAFSHGLRATEVIRLKRENFANGHLTVARLKGSLKTTQALFEHENELLNERKVVFDFLKNQTRNQTLFPITRQRFWQIIQECGEAAAIPKHKRHPHVLKHSIAMQTIQNAGIHNVRQHLGHKSLSSTGEYLKVTDAEATHAVSSAL